MDLSVTHPFFKTLVSTTSHRCPFEVGFHCRLGKRRGHIHCMYTMCVHFCICLSLCETETKGVNDENVIN